MLHVMVTADIANGQEQLVTLRERIGTADLESNHFAAQLVERLAWAVSDAHESGAGVPSEPTGPITPASREDPVRRAVLTGSSLPGGGGTMLAELQQAIASAVLAGVELDAIEDTIIGRAPVDEEQNSALWLYAEVLVERPADLIHKDPDDD